MRTDVMNAQEITRSRNPCYDGRGYFRRKSFSFCCKAGGVVILVMMEEGILVSDHSRYGKRE